MKKTGLFILTALGTVVLSSCTFIKNIFDPEKDYSLDNFKTLLADRKISTTVPYKSVIVKSSGTNMDGEKVEGEYTYNYKASTGEWLRSDNEMYDITLATFAYPNIITEVQEISGLSTKNKYNYHARKKEYRIGYSSNDSDSKSEYNWNYDVDGFLISVTSKITDKQSIKQGEVTLTLTYSK